MSSVYLNWFSLTQATPKYKKKVPFDRLSGFKMPTGTGFFSSKDSVYQAITGADTGFQKGGGG